MIVAALTIVASTALSRGGEDNGREPSQIMPNAPIRNDRDEELRSRMLAAAEKLLNASGDHDISTRAVCEEVGVGQPVLYRLFGDKNGLLNTLIENSFERYIVRKQSLETTEDPIADLRAGWDDHIDFARTGPALYRLMFSPVLPRAAEPVNRIFDLLKQTLDRCAAIGAIKVPTAEAAQTIMSANIGVALSVVSEPSRYSDSGLSHRVREAVFASCLKRKALEAPADAEDTGNLFVQPALQLEAQLARQGSPALDAEETALLLKWLRKLRHSD
jgi:AcrR family transcriptional regulator